MFSPRIGFAYSPHQLKRTVVRGGFGIYVAPVFPFNNAGNQEGFSQTTNSTVTGDNYQTPIDSLSNPFPKASFSPPDHRQASAPSLAKPSPSLLR